MIKSAVIFVGILFLAILAGGLWGMHEAFMHHWPAVAAKYPGISDWWNPNVSWTYKNRFPWWFPVQLTDGKHLLFTLQGACVAAAFWLIGREMLIVGGIKKLWPWGYVLYLGSFLICYTLGNWLTYDVIFG